MTDNQSDRTVSIIMPCYNAERYISEAIESVLSQTYLDWELIIVDDASTDESCKIISQYTAIDERIHKIKNLGQRGAAGARNTALDCCKGMYIAFLDADDMWYREKLSLQLDFMQVNNFDFTYSYIDVIDEQSNYLRSVKTPATATSELLKFSNYIPCLSVVYRRASAKEIRTPLIPSRNDFALWLSILNDGEVKEAICFPRILGAYRENSYGIASKKINSLKFFWICQYRFNNASIIDSSVRTLIYALVVIVKKKLPHLYNKLVQIKRK